MLFIAQRVARRRILQADDRADVARVNTVDILSFVGVHLNETPDALFFLLSGVVDVRARFQNAGIATEISERTHKRIGCDFKRKTGERLLVRGLSFNLFPRLGIGALDVRDVQRAGKEVDDRVEKELHALVFVGRTAKHGDRFHFQAAFAKPRNDFFLGKLHRIEVLLHELVVGGRRLLHELFTVLFCKRLHVLGNGLLTEILTQIVVVDLRFHADKVDDPAEIFLFSDGKFDRNGVCAEALLDHLFDAVKIRAVNIHFVYIRNAGHPVGIRLTPNGFRLGLDAALCAERSHRAVKHAQRTLDFYRKVNVSRGIDDIETVSFPNAGRRSRGDRNTAFLLLNHPVHRSGTVVRLADFVSFTRIKQDTLRRRRFACVDVRHDPEITGVF